jgi:hypothetical protein
MEFRSFAPVCKNVLKKTLELKTADVISTWFS